VVELEEQLFGGRWRLKRRGYGWWRRGNNGAEDNKKKHNQQMSGGRGGGRRRLARGRAQWWRRKSDCSTAAEEKQHHGGWSGGRRQVRRCSAVCPFFWMNPTSILPSTILPKKGGNFFDLGGRFLLQFKVGLGLGSFFGVSQSSYLQSYIQSYPNPT
jgi:hypothetical protein